MSLTQDIVLQCQLDDGRVLSKILAAIHLKQNQNATVVITEGGLKIYTESSQSFQASGWLRKELFSDFQFRQPDNDPSPMFGVNLTNLLQCLSMSEESVSASTAVKICYAGPGHPLVLMLDENGVMTDCGLRTLVTDKPLDFDFIASTAPNKFIVRSEVLRDAFTEFDLIHSGVDVNFILENNQRFCMSIDGPLSACEIEIPSTSEVVSKLECQTPQSNSYRLSFLKLTFQSLGLSRDACIRMNSKGILSMQVMIVLPNQQSAVVEFLVCPSIASDEVDQQEQNTRRTEADGEDSS
eukprot:c4657_g1_i1.p1 GENE.c4657_g1_i1~~c4657_g1_i1.p1  ORF type:complete len:296 (-),score=78.28 c4657_g1_i1:29-916(-)